MKLEFAITCKLLPDVGWCREDMVLLYRRVLREWHDMGYRVQYCVLELDSKGKEHIHAAVSYATKRGEWKKGESLANQEFMVKLKSLKFFHTYVKRLDDRLGWMQYMHKAPVQTLTYIRDKQSWDDSVHLMTRLYANAIEDARAAYELQLFKAQTDVYYGLLTEKRNKEEFERQVAFEELLRKRRLEKLTEELKKT